MTESNLTTDAGTESDSTTSAFGLARMVASEMRRCAHIRLRLVQLATAPIPEFAAGFVLSRAYRLAGFKHIDPTAFICGRLTITGTGPIEENLRMAAGSFISTNVTLSLHGPISLAKGSLLSPFVKVYTATHGRGPSNQRCDEEPIGKPVVIEEGAWIGLGATILPGVTIGRGSVVAAGAIVAKSCPPNSFVSGVPGVVTRQLHESADWFATDTPAPTPPAAPAPSTAAGPEAGPSPVTPEHAATGGARAEDAANGGARAEHAGPDHAGPDHRGNGRVPAPAASA